MGTRWGRSAEDCRTRLVIDLSARLVEDDAGCRVRSCPRPLVDFHLALDSSNPPMIDSPRLDLDCLTNM